MVFLFRAVKDLDIRFVTVCIALAAQNDWRIMLSAPSEVTHSRSFNINRGPIYPNILNEIALI